MTSPFSSPSSARATPAPPRPSKEDVPQALGEHGFVLEPGLVIANKYVLERPAGFGGMAQLWVATNQATGSEVCVKLLVPDPEKGGHDEEAVERFRREAHAAARLSHRAIVRVFDLLELDEDAAAAVKGRSPYAYGIVMELLRGETLGDLLAKRGKLPVEEALDLFLPVVSALGHAHRAFIVHRDIKPDNIFLAQEPDGPVMPKVLDFGVSKLENAAAITIDGVVVGTPCFMSPEQAKGSRQIDARSDVFCAGILLYTMLTGANPFEAAPTFASAVDAVLRREVVPISDLAPEIWSVIRKAIEKDPALRFGDATELGIALRRAAGRRATTESNPAIPIAPPSSGRVIAPGGAASTGNATPPRLPSAADVGDERVEGGAATARRAIVAGIMGACSAVLLAAITITLVRSKGTASGGRDVVPTGASTAGAAALAPSTPAPPTTPKTAPAESASPAAPVAAPAAVASAAAVAAPVAGASAESIASADSTVPADSRVPTPAAENSSKSPTSPPEAKPTMSLEPARLPRRGPTVPDVASGRKPGQEPQNARDPGF